MSYERDRDAAAGSFKYVKDVDQDLFFKQGADWARNWRDREIRDFFKEQSALLDECEARLEILKLQNYSTTEDNLLLAKLKARREK